MKKVFLLVAGCGILVGSSFAQSVSQKLQKAFQQFESDSQLRHAISSLYVIDAKTGDVVFERNAQVGLAPASTQKIITSVTAFELLGKEYRYKTELGYTGRNDDGTSGDLIVAGYGDPTLGSSRYTSTVDSAIYKEFCTAIKKAGIKKYGTIRITSLMEDFSPKSIPDGWIWQDIGNYYGASALTFNWKENQFDLILKSEDRLGGGVQIINTVPSYFNKASFVNYLSSGEKGSGDNAYVYLKDGHYMLAGTIPRGENNFRISAAAQDTRNVFDSEFKAELLRSQIRSESNVESIDNKEYLREPVTKTAVKFNNIYTHHSPSLDSIIYWFNKKSINLYGEALVKTFAYEKTGFGSTDTGVAIVKKFWNQKGLDEDELNIYDGSGLSPLNRVTTHAQVEILKYAKTKDWFLSFYDALPEYNGMKMKSGTISDVKGFCGYHTAKDGKEYIFSFLVNNYSSRASQLLSKMYKVLDVLK